MPLVTQQDIVVLEDLRNANANVYVEALRQKLETYPPCRIVSIAMVSNQFGAVSKLVAVVETV